MVQKCGEKSTTMRYIPKKKTVGKNHGMNLTTPTVSLNSQISEPAQLHGIKFRLFAIKKQRQTKVSNGVLPKNAPDMSHPLF